MPLLQGLPKALPWLASSATDLCLEVEEGDNCWIPGVRMFAASATGHTRAENGIFEK